MIFPTIMFWVWMAAQTPHTHILAKSDPGQCPTCKPMECDGRGNCTAQSWTPSSPEHVIEIRTKREYGWCGGPNRNDVNAGVVRFTPFPKHPIDHHGSCQGPPDRTVKEVYVDGVKWGVLKEGQ